MSQYPKRPETYSESHIDRCAGYCDLLNFRSSEPIQQIGHVVVMVLEEMLYEMKRPKISVPVQVPTQYGQRR